MEPSYFEFSFFGSAALWMLVTYPAYWVFQWVVEGEPFHLWSRRAISATAALSHTAGQSWLEAGDDALGGMFGADPIATQGVLDQPLPAAN